MGPKWASVYSSEIELLICHIKTFPNVNIMKLQTDNTTCTLTKISIHTRNKTYTYIYRVCRRSLWIRLC